MPDQQPTFSGWFKAYLVSVLAFVSIFGYVVWKETHRPLATSACSSNNVKAAELWMENQRLKEDNEWLRMQNHRHAVAWAHLDKFNKSQCDFPPRKFDYHFDFAYAHCKPANKEHQSWNIITKHIWGRVLYWNCDVREGGAPEDHLPRKQRKVMRRDIDGCVLHWTQVLDRGVGKGQTSVPARGLRVDVNWELKTKEP